jgi:hypothetical protein
MRRGWRKAAVAAGMMGAWGGMVGAGAAMAAQELLTLDQTVDVLEDVHVRALPLIWNEPATHGCPTYEGSNNTAGR